MVLKNPKPDRVTVGARVQFLTDMAQKSDIYPMINEVDGYDCNWGKKTHPINKIQNGCDYNSYSSVSQSGKLF